MSLLSSYTSYYCFRTRVVRDRVSWLPSLRSALGAKYATCETSCIARDLLNGTYTYAPVYGICRRVLYRCSGDVARTEPSYPFSRIRLTTAGLAKLRNGSPGLRFARTCTRRDARCTRRNWKRRRLMSAGGPNFPETIKPLGVSPGRLTRKYGRGVIKTSQFRAAAPLQRGA